MNVSGDNLYKYDYPLDVLTVLKVLKENNYSAYLVGGCVRDLIAGIEPHDWDICTNALPTEIESCFEKTVPTGIQHGTVSVNINHVLYEVTTYRYDEIYDNSHIPVSVSFDRNKDGIYHDLSRRDFTINAMAYDPIAKELVDPYYGVNDMSEGNIKAVGDADKRFTEDPLRMLRAIRFSCYFPGFKIDDVTFKAIQDNSELLKYISSERIYSEMKKMLITSNPENMMLLHDSHLDKVFFPEFDVACRCAQNHPYHNASVGQHSINTVCHCSNDYVLRFAALFHDLGKPVCKTTDSRGDHFYGHPEVSKNMAENIMSRWKFSNEDKTKISNLVLEHDTLGYVKDKNWNLTLKKLMFKYGDTFVSDLLKLSEADMKAHSALAIEKKGWILHNINDEYENIHRNKEPYRLRDLVVNGNDIIDLGFKDKMVGGILTYMMLDVMKHPNHNDRDYLLSEDTLKTYVYNLRLKMNLESHYNRDIDSFDIKEDNYVLEV